MQIRAQFEFWWLNLWDIIDSVYFEDGSILPDQARLEARSRLVGGTKSMSSFTDDEMEKIASAFEIHRTAGGRLSGVSHVVEQNLLPNLLRVEYNFQGYGSRYDRRPRTDGSSARESLLLKHCQRALAGYRSSHIGPAEEIYYAICGLLDRALLEDESGRLRVAYAALIEACNACHAASPVKRLHVPAKEFWMADRTAPSSA